MKSKAMVVGIVALIANFVQADSHGYFFCSATDEESMLAYFTQVLALPTKGLEYEAIEDSFHKFVGGDDARYRHSCIASEQKEEMSKERSNIRSRRLQGGYTIREFVRKNRRQAEVKASLDQMRGSQSSTSENDQTDAAKRECIEPETVGKVCIISEGTSQSNYEENARKLHAEFIEQLLLLSPDATIDWSYKWCNRHPDNRNQGSCFIGGDIENICSLPYRNENWRMGKWVFREDCSERNALSKESARRGGVLMYGLSVD